MIIVSHGVGMTLTVDTRDLEGDMRRFADKVTRFPRGKNPLEIWMRGYLLRERLAARPTVGASGLFRGNAWPALKWVRKRKTDGETVYVWGGNKRLAAGIVTRARPGSERIGASRAERKAGFGIVKVGQIFSKGPVKGKLKSDGTRYTRGDKQLGRSAGGHLFGEWINPRNINVSASGLTVKQTLPDQLDEQGARIHKTRMFAWGPQIEAQEAPLCQAEVEKYIENAIREEIKP